MPTGPRYCLMTDRWNLTKQRLKKNNLMKATSCGGELSFCLETVQNFLLETFRQLLWFIKSAYWREGDGEKRLSLFQQQRFSQTVCKNKSSETGLYPGKPGSWAGACGVALGDREPVSSGPSHFSSETKSPRQTAPPASTGPTSIPPPSGVKI